MKTALQARFPVVPHWRLLWRAWSTRMLALSALLGSVNESMPESVHHVVGPYLGVVIWFASVVGLVSRYIKQFDLPVTPKENTMSAFATLEAEIAAAADKAEAEVVATFDAARALARTNAGKAVINTAVAALPAEDQAIASIASNLAEGSTTLAQALPALYAAYEAAKATVPPGYVPAPAVEAPAQE